MLIMSNIKDVVFLSGCDTDEEQMIIDDMSNIMNMVFLSLRGRDVKRNS